VTVSGDAISNDLSIGATPKTKKISEQVATLVMTRQTFQEAVYERQQGYTSKAFWQANVFHGEGSCIQDRFNRTCALLRMRHKPLDLSVSIRLSIAADETKMKQMESE
jgi:hypothetical protein